MVSEQNHLLAPFTVLHLFALWVASDPSSLDQEITRSTPFEPVSVSVVKKYLSAVKAWYVVQGWPLPLLDEDQQCINWSLRGLENIQGGCKCPLHPPLTMIIPHALKLTLKISSNSFDACMWAAASCAFWGMMRFSEILASL
jgi:hypothetical protein